MIFLIGTKKNIIFKYVNNLNNMVGYPNMTYGRFHNLYNSIYYYSYINLFLVHIF